MSRLYSRNEACLIAHREFNNLSLDNGYPAFLEFIDCPLVSRHCFVSKITQMILNFMWEEITLMVVRPVPRQIVSTVKSTNKLIKRSKYLLQKLIDFSSLQKYSALCGLRYVFIRSRKSAYFEQPNQIHIAITQLL